MAESLCDVVRCRTDGLSAYAFGTRRANISYGGSHDNEHPCPGRTMNILSILNSRLGLLVSVSGLFRTANARVTVFCPNSTI